MANYDFQGIRRGSFLFVSSSLSLLLSLLRAIAVLIISSLWRALKWLAAIATLLVLTLIATVVALTIVFPTNRDEAYRRVDPEAPICDFVSGNRSPGPWTILAKVKRDGNNDEIKAVSNDGIWATKLQCALQRHEIPYSVGSTTRSLAYNLSFVEFKEDGSPYELTKPDGNLYSADELSRKVRYIDRQKWAPITQLRALTNFLRVRSGRNYVIVFVHGWRHDSRIGDDNVADLRRYAALAARFLRDRCDAGETEQCDRDVTAVYIGWRGARVDEEWLERPFTAVGNLLDGGSDYCNRTKIIGVPTQLCWKDTLGALAKDFSSVVAALTLFDRKPVSETIAPHVLTALRSIESALDFAASRSFDKRDNPNRLIVIGHSLGGNLLATALKDDVVKRVRNHPGNDEYFEAPLGNLAVLINPASEASKWTSIQRAVWEKIAFRAAEVRSEEEYSRGHHFFPQHQRPVLISVTSAFAWPAGGIRAEDCASAANAKVEFLDKPPPPRGEVERRRNALAELQNAVETVDQKAKVGVKYDSATHDIFPFFKRDFRPIADRLEAYGRWLDDPAPQPSCIYSKRVPPQTTLARWIVGFADFMRDAPFQNTDMEDTRTIGNLDVPRHSAGTLAEYLVSARPFGATHEIRGTRSRSEAPVDYADIPTTEIAKCPISHNWLTRARQNAEPHGTSWDSDRLYRAADAQSPKKTISARITHGFFLAGIEPITRANDPFWNMRAYDDVLAEHNGYLLSSFICAMNQIVMDRATSLPAHPSLIPRVSDQPKNPAEMPTPLR